MAFGDYEDPRPRHEQIAAELRAQIMCGDLGVGAKLDGLNTYAKHFATSVQTMQRAFELLAHEGFVVTAPGKRSVVRSSQPFKIEATSWIDLSDGDYRYGTITLAEERPPADVADALGLDAGDVAVMRHRVLFHQDRPAEASWAYYKTSLAHGTDLMYPKRIPGGVPRVFADLGLPYSNPEDSLSWREPTLNEASLLFIPAHVPVLRALRVFRDQEGAVTEASVLVKPGHLYEVTYRLFEA